MGNILADLLLWIEQLSPVWVYFILFMAAFAENVFPPSPGDVLKVFGGYLIGLGYIAFVPALIATTVGGAIGFMVMYALGSRIGAPLFDPGRMRWVNKQLVFKARDWTHKYGLRIVAANRFLSGIRSVIALTVGASRLSVVPVAFWATVSSALWSLVVLLLGVYLGEEWEAVEGWLRGYGTVLFALILLFATLHSAKRLRRQMLARRSREDLV